MDSNEVDPRYNIMQKELLQHLYKQSSLIACKAFEIGGNIV
jgi:hypothetical protein